MFENDGRREVIASSREKKTSVDDFDSVFEFLFDKTTTVRRRRMLYDIIVQVRLCRVDRPAVPAISMLRRHTFPRPAKPRAADGRVVKKKKKKQNEINRRRSRNPFFCFFFLLFPYTSIMHRAFKMHAAPAERALRPGAGAWE